MRSFRQLLVGVVLATFAISALAQAPAVRKRRNVDCLSADDVATFRHAFDVLKKRDPAKDNPADPLHNSFQWYTVLHNGDGGVSTCNHGNELFLTWHRALLLVFEKALQESDPANGTRSIMLPYWNWAVDPTGSRYPKIFEVKGDVLYATRSTKQPKNRLYGEQELKQMIQDNPTWRMFGGAECHDSDCPASGFGSFEHPYHNMMHGWIGGAMLVDTTAAVDPLFWAFHNYIDLVFARWQLAHPGEKPGCADCPLRGMPTWTPAKVTNTQDLGYEYDLTTCPTLAAAGAAASMSMLSTAKPSMSLIKPKQSMASGPVVVDVTIPQPGFDSAEVRIGGAEIPSTFSYRGAVYLYPAGTKLATTDEEFRQRYRIGEYSVWSLHHGQQHAQQHAQPVADLFVNATTELRYLAKKYPGAHWKLAVVLDDVQLNDTEAKAVSLSIRSEVKFDEVSLVFDRALVGGTR